jgi:hypothetical protein
MEILFLNPKSLKKDCNGKMEYGLLKMPKPIAPKKLKLTFYNSNKKAYFCSQIKNK